MYLSWWAYLSDGPGSGLQRRPLFNALLVTTACIGVRLKNGNHCCQNSLAIQ